MKFKHFPLIVFIMISSNVLSQIDNTNDLKSIFSNLHLINQEFTDWIESQDIIYSFEKEIEGTLILSLIHI